VQVYRTHDPAYRRDNLVFDAKRRSHNESFR